MENNGILNTPATIEAICNMLTKKQLIDIRLNGNFFYTKGLLQILKNIQENIPERCSSPIKKQKVDSFIWGNVCNTECQYANSTWKLRSLNLRNNLLAHCDNDYQELLDIYRKI